MLNRIFIDTRSEFESSHYPVEGLKSYPYVKAISNPDAFCDYCREHKESEIIFVCRSGRRSKKLQKLLVECDFDTEKVSVMNLLAYTAMVAGRKIEE